MKKILMEAALLAATGAHAATYYDPGLKVTVVCDACAPLVGSVTYPNPGDTGNSSPAAEAAYLNNLLGSSFTAADVLKTDPPTGHTQSLVGAYFWLKQGSASSGGGTWYFASNGDTEFTWCKGDTTACANDTSLDGLSHWGQTKNGHEVPVPGTLGLLGLGLLGLGVARRKQ